MLIPFVLAAIVMGSLMVVLSMKDRDWKLDRIDVAWFVFALVCLAVVVLW